MDQTKHNCPATNCAMTLPRHLLMCRSHWYIVPSHLRADVNRLWKLVPRSRSYLAARQDAIDAVNAKLAAQPQQGRMV